MFDRGDASANSHLDRFGSVGVGGNFATPKRRFIHGGFHFFRRILWRTDRFFLGKNAGAGQDFDPIRAVFDVCANGLTDRLRPVRHSRRDLLEM